MANKTVYKIVFRVKKAYYEQIVAGTKSTEYRAEIPYWQKLLSSLNKFFERAFGVQNWLEVNRTEPWIAEVARVQAIFITCQKGVRHIREVKAIGHMPTPNDAKAVITTPQCYFFILGDEVKADV